MPTCDIKQPRFHPSAGLVYRYLSDYQHDHAHWKLGEPLTVSHKCSSTSPTLCPSPLLVVTPPPPPPHQKKHWQHVPSALYLLSRVSRMSRWTETLFNRIRTNLWKLLGFNWILVLTRDTSWEARWPASIIWLMAAAWLSAAMRPSLTSSALKGPSSTLTAAVRSDVDWIIARYSGVFVPMIGSYLKNQNSPALKKAFGVGSKVNPTRACAICKHTLNLW